MLGPRRRPVAVTQLPDPFQHRVPGSVDDGTVQSKRPGSKRQLATGSRRAVRSRSGSSGRRRRSRSRSHGPHGGPTPGGPDVGPPASITGASSSAASRKPAGHDRAQALADSGVVLKSHHDALPADGRAPSPLQGGEEGSAKAQKKEKRFAWMDSGDESGAEDSGVDSGADAKCSDPSRNVEEGGSLPSSSKEDRDSSGTGAASSETRPFLARVTEVRTFADMIRLAPDVQHRAPRMTPQELAAVVTAAARVRFYDAEVFQEGVLPAVRRHLLQRSRVAFSSEEVVDLIAGLAGLNVYDQAIFTKIADHFSERKHELEDPQRCVRLLTAFKAVGHKSDGNFIEYLNQRKVAEAYQQRLSEIQGSGGPLIYYGGLRH